LLFDTDLGTDLPARRIREGQILFWLFAFDMAELCVSGKRELDLIVPLSSTFGLKRASLDGAAFRSPLVLLCSDLVERHRRGHVSSQRSPHSKPADAGIKLYIPQFPT